LLLHAWLMCNECLDSVSFFVPWWIYFHKDPLACHQDNKKNHNLDI
jgi:hypothetical protein